MAKLTFAGSLIVASTLAVLWNASATALAADLQGNIPANRLAGNTYSSPDGNFVLTLPPLVMPGAKAQERRTGDVQIGVFFADDFGNLYYVLRTDNTKMKYDLDKVAAGYTINDALREKEIVPTTRGSELRLAGILPGGSPIVRQTTVKGKTVQQNVNLHQAMSLFLTDVYIFEVAAGVTGLHQESDAELFARAKQNLEAFLDGLRIKTDAPPRN